MLKLTIEEFERKVIDDLRGEKEFLEFLKENKGLELVEKREVKIPVEKNGNNYFLEDMVPEFLEEISHYIPVNKDQEKELLGNIDEEESRDILLKGYLREIGALSFNYLKAGIDYMDLIQEGTIAMIEGMEEYRESYGDFKEYIKAILVREYVLYIYEKLEEEKYEYLSYLNHKKHENEHVEEIEEIEEVDLDEDEEEIKKEEKLEPKKIEEKIKEVENMNIFKIPNKLTEEEIDVLKLYYGFIGDKRESVFEIENDLGMENGAGEEIFLRALNRVSTVGGRVFKI